MQIRFSLCIFRNIHQRATILTLPMHVCKLKKKKKKPMIMNLPDWFHNHRLVLLENEITWSNS